SAGTRSRNASRHLFSRRHSGARRRREPGIQGCWLGACRSGFRVRGLRPRPGMTAARQPPANHHDTADTKSNGGFLNPSRRAPDQWSELKGEVMIHSLRTTVAAALLGALSATSAAAAPPSLFPFERPLPPQASAYAP